MIKFTTGNLFDSSAEALVNTVNCVGVMGKGIALECKKRFPENYIKYREACDQGHVLIGLMFVTNIDYSEFNNPYPEDILYIVNFPTKQHWKNPSKLEWIVSGLDSLRSFLINYEIQSVAIPALGCGNGGLDWSTVRPIIVEKLQDLPIDITIYEPTPFTGV